MCSVKITSTLVNIELWNVGEKTDGEEGAGIVEDRYKGGKLL